MGRKGQENLLLISWTPKKRKSNWGRIQTCLRNL